jgi:uncharacterized protein YcbX
MKELKLTQINIYPVKSLGGIPLSSAFVEPRGLRYDRRWMIVDEQNKFITQRDNPTMALIGTRMDENGFELFHKHFPENKIYIPLAITHGKLIKVQVWQDECQALHWNEEADNWLTTTLGLPCKLVYMPNDTLRFVDSTYVLNKEITSFSDGYPFLIIGDESLLDLNSKLDVKVPMNRFRPNFVFEGGEAFAEDNWSKFRIGEVNFWAVKPCGRCKITTIDQENANQSKEPLRTLSKYRTKKNSVLFGQNLVTDKGGKIAVGDKLFVEELKRKK